MPVNRSNPVALEKYREYQKTYHKYYGRRYYKYDPEQKKKYYEFRKISVIFRNILLEN